MGANPVFFAARYVRAIEELGGIPSFSPLWQTVPPERVCSRTRRTVTDREDQTFLRARTENVHRTSFESWSARRRRSNSKWSIWRDAPICPCSVSAAHASDECGLWRQPVPRHPVRYEVLAASAEQLLQHISRIRDGDIRKLAPAHPRTMSLRVNSSHHQSVKPSRRR